MKIKKKRTHVRQHKRRTKTGISTVQKHSRKLGAHSKLKTSLHKYFKPTHPFEDEISDLIAMDRRIFKLKRRIKRLEDRIDRANFMIAELGAEGFERLPDEEKKKRRQMTGQLWAERKKAIEELKDLDKLLRDQYHLMSEKKLKKELKIAGLI